MGLKDESFPLGVPGERLTKREYFAALAMQGIITYRSNVMIQKEKFVAYSPPPYQCAAMAVKYADALIEEVKKK